MDTSLLPALPVDYLALEGNIGAGKTTLARLLAERYGCELVLEQFDDNPFLPLFYEDQERYALMVELFFMAERHGQLGPLLTTPSLFARPVLADYTFIKTWLFARKTLRAHELELFRKLFVQLNENLPLPRKLIFIHRPIPVLLQLIAKRNRSYESKIGGEYLSRVQRTYWDYFREEKRFPIVVVNVGKGNFEQDQALLDRLIKIIGKPFQNGLNIVELDDAAVAAKSNLG